VCIKALLEVVDGGAKNIEIVVMPSPGAPAKTLPEERLAEVVAVIEKEAEEAKASVDTANIDPNA
jgi:20S proteasome subunit alpha 4